MKYLYIIILLSLFGCHKDSIHVSKRDIVPVAPSSLTQTHLVGFVTDHLYRPIDQCSISVRNKSCLSDKAGFFSLNHVSLGSKGDVISFAKDGYFDSFTSLFPLPNQKLNVQVQLIPKPPAQVFNPGEYIRLSLQGGGNITIPPYSLQTQEGALVFEDIHVFMYEMVDLCNSLCIPVNFETGFERQEKINPNWLLMLRVEDARGNRLQLVPGKELEFKPSSSLNGNSLFSYSYGYWHRIDSVSSLPVIRISSLPRRLSSGNVYPYVLVKGKITLPNGNNSNTFTQSVYAIHSFSQKRHDYTVLSSLSGAFILPVRAQIDTKVKVVDICEQVVLTKNLSAYTTDPSRDLILPIQLFPSPDFVASGKLINTEGKYITNGLVTVRLDNGLSYKQWVNNNGSFYLSMNNCDSKFMDISFFDLDSLRYLSFTKPTDHSYSFNAKLSQTLGQFVSIQIDSSYPYLFDSPTISYDKTLGKVSIQNDQCCSFGVLEITFDNRSPVRVPSYSFTSFSQENLIFQPSLDELKGIYASLTITEENDTFITGKILLSFVPDIYNNLHSVNIQFKVAK